MILERPGALINYEVWGEAGTPVVLINGHTRPLNDFRMLGRHLVECGCVVAALDNRGAGKTETSAPFDLAAMADDVLSVMDACGFDAAGLLGISMGGFIAQTATLAAPQRVTRLALVSTAARQTAIRQDDTPWDTDLARVEAKLAPYFTADFAQRNAMLVKSMAKQIAAAAAGGAYQARVDAQKVAVRGFDVLARLGAVRCPTLVVHGAEDLIVPLEAGRELAASLPDSQLEILPAAGHLLLAERPRELYALVADFFTTG